MLESCVVAIMLTLHLTDHKPFEVDVYYVSEWPSELENSVKLVFPKFGTLAALFPAPTRSDDWAPSSTARSLTHFQNFHSCNLVGYIHSSSGSLREGGTDFHSPMLPYLGIYIVKMMILLMPGMVGNEARVGHRHYEQALCTSLPHDCTTLDPSSWVVNLLTDNYPEERNAWSELEKQHSYRRAISTTQAGYNSPLAHSRLVWLAQDSRLFWRLVVET